MPRRVRIYIDGLSLDQLALGYPGLGHFRHGGRLSLGADLEGVDDVVLPTVCRVVLL
jgi:hypothetical protein